MVLKTYLIMTTLAMLAIGWTATSKDSICGLKNVKTVSNPAVINWDSAIDETQEVKTINRKKISKTSPQGVILMQRAKDRVTKGSVSVMKSEGHDSVWKKITHKSKKAPDITKKVVATY